jgi:hypothetical protein
MKVMSEFIANTSIRPTASAPSGPSQRFAQVSGRASTRNPAEKANTTQNQAQKLANGTPKYSALSPRPQSHIPSRMASASSARSMFSASSPSSTGRAHSGSVVASENSRTV